MNPRDWGAALLVTIAMIAAMGTAWGQEPEVSSMRATCLVRISSPRNVFPLNEDVIRSLIFSSPVAGDSIRTILGVDSTAVDDVGALDFVMLDQSQSDERTVLLGELSLELSEGAKPRAADFLRALCANMRAALVVVGESEMKNWVERDQAIELELEKLKQESARILQMQRELFAEAGRDDLDRGPILEMIRNYEERKEELRLRLAGMQAKQQALTQEIAKAAQRVEEDPGNQAIMNGLQRIVELRQKALDRIRQLHESGRSSDEDVNNAEIQVIQAQSDLARQREALREQIGGGLMGGMNQQLRELNIEYEDSAAEMGVVLSRLDEVRDKNLVELSERYTADVEIPKHMIERMIMDLKEQQYKLKERLRTVGRPELQIIGE